MLKRRGLISIALLLSAPTFAASVLVVCADEPSRNLKDDLTELLSSTKSVVKVAGPKAPATACLSQVGARRQECFATAGGAANVEAILLVSTSAKAGALTVTFEVLSATDGKQQRREVLRTSGPRFKAQAAPVLKRVILPVKHKPESVQVAKKADPLPVAPTPVAEAQPVPDRPMAEVPLQPTMRERPLDIVTLPPPRASPKVGAWVATGGAVVAAGVAGTFGGLALINRGQLARSTDGVSPLTYSQAQSLQRTANLQLSVALGAAIAAGVSGGLAAVLWSRD